MEHVRIRELRPDLHALETKQIRAVVTLIWPYSPSQRQFALLLAEPDIRLRRNKGQVRARFSSTSARVLATTGVGIGDEVLLSLQGAQFVQGHVSTPGKSIDWELAYTQTVAVSVWRNGAEIASLDIVNAVPTPAPRSPVKKPAAAPSPLSQWSSPAFAKRARLSDGPFFDSFPDGDYDGHDKKRRRKSYRDWTAWTYAARTPSPGKGDLELDDESEEALSSPSRPPQLPKTPVSPTRLASTSVAVPPVYDPDYVEESTIADSAEGDTTVDDGDLHKVQVSHNKSPDRQEGEALRNRSRSESNEGLNDGPPDSQYDFGGDTEVNTEDEDEDEEDEDEEDEEDDTVPDHEIKDTNTPEIPTELGDESDADEGSAASDVESIAQVEVEADAGVASETEEDSHVDASKTRQVEYVPSEGEDTTIDETVPEILEPAIVVEESESVAVAMPPPSLPTLQTNFAVPATTDVWTPIGKEPSSPNLKAVDSATLPLPSPFPGEHIVSYFEGDSVEQQDISLDRPVTQLEVETPHDADYIVEGSFFNSVSSSKAGGFHQDHDTAFTPVRFTFGVDGVGWARPPLDLSSPSPEDSQPGTAQNNDDRATSPGLITIGTTIQEEAVLLEKLSSGESGPNSSMIEDTNEDLVDEMDNLSKPNVDAAQSTPEAVVVASDSRRFSVVSISSSRVELDKIEYNEEDVVVGSSDNTQEEPVKGFETESIEIGVVETEEEHTPEPEAGEAGTTEALITDDEVHVAANKTTDDDPRSEPEQLESQEDFSTGTQVSAAVSAIIDLGSPSSDESSDAESDMNDLVGPASAETATGGDGIESENSLRVASSSHPGHSDIVTASRTLDSMGKPEVLNFDEFIGRGSPSADEISDAEDDASDLVASAPVATAADGGEDTSETPTRVASGSDPNSFDIASAPRTLDPIQGPEQFNFDEFIGRTSPSPEQQVRQRITSPIPDTYEEPDTVSLSDDWEPQLGMDEPLPFVEHDDEMQIDLSNDTSNETQDVQRDLRGTQVARTDVQDDTEQPDVKMESIEDGSLYFVSQPDPQNVSQEADTEPSAEILIAVSDDNGSKLGELSTKSVPATAPARNTRSKAKIAASPPEQEAYVSRLSASTRRTRSKTSFDSTTRDTTSPTQSRAPARSTVTPTRDATLTSPYSLRSQSKLLSPGKFAAPTSPQTATALKSTRKLVRRDTDFDIVPSQTESRDLFGGVFEPSQELGFGYSQLSQGRFSGVGYVKDSEEGTSHSEGSISTLQPSDPVESAGDVQPATPRLKPSPASSPHTQRQTRSTSRSMGQQSSVVSPNEPPQSQRRSPRFTRSTFTPTPSPRIVRATRKLVQVSSPVSHVVETNQEEQSTPTDRKQTAVSLVLPTEDEDEDEDEDDVLSSPPASAQRPQSYESNPMAQVETQQTLLEPPLSFQPRQFEQSLTTSTLTQTTSASASLRSFDIPLPGVQTQPAPHSPILRTSPRRPKPAATAVRSSSPTAVTSSSPPHRSSSAISPATPTAEATAEATAEPTTASQESPANPSIGLSTPLAYYTPLRDLPYFLNRSSQFHSGANPDLLCLCTASSSPPLKAKKGPRHWSTTFHITDISVWPQTRAVSVFRPYAEALPVVESGDVILLRAFQVLSEKRTPVLRSGEESSWCVWRYGKPVWGKKRGAFGEVRAREEVKGPVVERGPGEWGEVEKLRAWFLGGVREELEGEGGGGVE